MRKKWNRVLTHALAFALLFTMAMGVAGTEAKAESSGNSGRFETVIEFEDAKRFEQNGRNELDSSRFSGYSGSGYLYLVSGWGEVGFTVPQDGEYRITVVSNADTYKENWLYLDESSVGTLYTASNRWESHTVTSWLSAGEHKFGVSTSWGYTALDYVRVEAVGNSSGGSQEQQGSGMYVENGKLYAANGSEFMLRGVNVAHAWYPEQTQTSINAIADLGANSVRVVLADGYQWTKTEYSEVEQIISWCESRGLICILEVHDHTGHDGEWELNTAVDYWCGMKDLLNEHSDYVIVNIANEWLGTWGYGSIWASAYQNAIRTLRNAGIENVLMVDAAGYGQETSSCIDYCQSVASADVMGNTMFSMHMYSVAGKELHRDRQMILRPFRAPYHNASAVSLIGGGSDNIIPGEISLAHNGVLLLDLSYDWNGQSLTGWGNHVFYANGIGIQATAKKAY